MLLVLKQQTNYRCNFAQGGSVVNVTFGKTKEVEEVLIKTYFENNFRCSWKSCGFVSDCIGEEAKTAAKLQAGEVYCWKTYVFIKRKKQEMLLLQKNWLRLVIFM
jgi:hypothetical protein